MRAKLVFALLLISVSANAATKTWTGAINDGTDSINGTFRGLPEGAVVIVSGKPLRVSYKSGDGNDVSLTVVAAPAADIPTLSHLSLLILAVVLAGLLARAIR